MNLCDVWERQKAFQKLVDDKVWKDQSVNRDAKCKEYLLCLVKETMELLDEFDWKLHRKHIDSEPDKEKIFEEMIDIFKYWLDFGLEWGFTPNDFFKKFREKSDLVEERFVREHGEIN